MDDPSHNQTNPTNPSYSQADTQASHPSQNKHHTPHPYLPATIGRYRIESLIGQGGMGAVYKAQQDSPRRTVALKVIKAGVASKNLLLRFEIEAQILGKLDHPGIATIYEAGTFDEGQGTQPFFAMEFVEGQELLDYANSKNLGTRDRLTLLAKIADAVQHAHQKGIIHRDLKPGNILVNNKGQIKVLDFGVARATDADIQTATMQTDIGQLIGTIPYMSPEQASGNPDDLDTRSDVYAIGVIAYELLTGQMPYDLKQKMIHEAVRVIREDQPKALSTINKTFRGDVEIIVSKALVKEKEHRYQSASDLSSDIERYLNNEPIEARPPSTWYQLTKFSKRNKALVAGVIAVLIVSIAGALISINFAMGEAEQKRIAIQAADDARLAEESTQRELTRANEVKKLITDMFSSISPEQAQGQDISMLKGILDDTSDRLTSGEINDELIAAELHHVIGEVYRKLGLFTEAELHLPVSAEIRTRLLKKENRQTLISMNSLALLYGDQGRYTEAQPLYLETLEILKHVLGDEHPQTLSTKNNLAALYRNQGRYTEAQPLYLETLEIRNRVLGEEHPETLQSMNNLAALYYTQRRYSEAEPLYLETLEIRKRLLGDEHPQTLVTKNNLANLYGDQGRNDEAELLYLETLKIQERVLGEEHPITLSLMNNLAALYYNQRRYSKAQPMFLKTLGIQRRVLGEEHPVTLGTMINLAVVYRTLGQYAEAESLCRETLEIYTRVLGDDHPNTQIVINNLCVVLDRQGRWSESEEYRRLLVEISRRAEPAGSAQLGSQLAQLGINLITQDRYADAQPVLAECLELRQQVLPEGHWFIWNTQSLLGETLAKQSKFIQAEPMLIQAAQQITPPETYAYRRDEAIQRVIDLYTAWHISEPNSGYDTKAQEWQTKLASTE